MNLGNLDNPLSGLSLVCLHDTVKLRHGNLQDYTKIVSE